MDYVYFFYIALISTLYLFLRHRYSYWKRRNVPHVKPVFPLGNLNQLKTFNLLDKLNHLYTNFKSTSPIAGMFFFTKPAVVALDLSLIKSILITDFSNFTDRMQFGNATHDPLSDNLFKMRGSRWRAMRAKLTPSFTSGKMKFMFPIVVDVAKKFEAALRFEMAKENFVEIRQLLTRFTTDVIGTCAFGIQCNSLRDPDAEFYKYGLKIMEKPRKSSLLRFFIITFGDLATKLGLNPNHARNTEFFMKVVKETVAVRETNNIQRNDFMSLLIELKNQKGPDGLGGLTIEEIAAQVFIFFVAGYETSASSMSLTLFELAKHPVIQDKVRGEILRVLAKHNNELSYEAMLEMTYLNQCISESMRKYPALVYLTRMANENYPIPGTKLKIEKGTPVIIPMMAIHYDPDIYPNPTKYDPDRFSADNVRTRDGTTFLAFGGGPRNCIGLRFARMQVRIGLIALLKSFKFSLAENTPEEIAFNPKTYLRIPRDGIRLKIEEIQVTTEKKTKF